MKQRGKETVRDMQRDRDSYIHTQTFKQRVRGREEGRVGANN